MTTPSQNPKKNTAFTMPSMPLPKNLTELAKAQYKGASEEGHKHWWRCDCGLETNTEFEGVDADKFHDAMKDILRDTPAPADSSELDEILDSCYPPRITTHRDPLGYDVIDNLGEHMAAKFNAPTKEELKSALTALILEKQQEARLVERKEIALDNYQGQTFSDSTNWEGKFQKFIDNNEKRIKSLKAQQEKK